MKWCLSRALPLALFLVQCSRTPSLYSPMEVSIIERFATAEPLPRTLPVFPGAQGFGTGTSAGRGGVVYEVTSLADSGAGTLREACEASGARTVVFRVGGSIPLKSRIYVKHPFLTVAGQTAPGDGILIRDFGVTLMASDILLQHLRIRPGEKSDPTPENNDALSIITSSDAPGVKVRNIVVDHCSLGWGEDEVVEIIHRVSDITLSYCVISEGIASARHPKGAHSSGLIIGYRANFISVHHTLFAHNSFRNPLIHDGGLHEFVNNVVYDWQDGCIEISDFNLDTKVNLAGNLFIRGAGSTNGFKEIVAKNNSFAKAKLFLSDNLGPSRAAGEDEWIIAQTDWGSEPLLPEFRSAARFDTPTPASHAAAQVKAVVLSNAGATRPRRDAVDVRVAGEVVSLTGRIRTGVDDAGGFPTLVGGAASADADHDGMPDAWEAAHGLNPNDASDGKADLDGDGYTNLEEYLHSLL